MSALTFETLSAELTQALAEQSHTPPKTTARCTLGRDKVMVLVEYPLDSAQAEPLAGETLDWLEQQLRHQFDTAGLPEAAADLAEAGSEVPVQLFLKHLSEPKPFTMRSFIWKVDDGFDDLFGGANTYAEPIVAQPQSERYAAEVGQAKAVQRQLFVSQLGQVNAATSVVSRLEDTDDKPFFYSAAEQSSADKAHEPGATDISATGISAIQTGVFPENITAEQPIFTPSLQEGAIGEEVGEDIDEEAVNEEDQSMLLALDSEDLQLDIESDLIPESILEEADSLLAEQSMELTLPGESPEFESEDFSLPAVEILPGGSAFELHPAHADFFDIDGGDMTPADPVDSSAADLTAALEASFLQETQGAATEEIEIDIEEPDGSTNLADYNLSRSALDSELASEDRLADGRGPVEHGPVESEPIQPDPTELEPIEFELLKPESVGSESLESEADSGAIATTEGALAHSELDPTAPYEDESHIEVLYVDALEEDASEEDVLYEDDPVYYLEGEAEGEEPVEDVASVDEGEVQRQREQWEQQSQANSWVFAGAIGFVVVGVLGFVLTRPCTFGSCDRIQTAQQTGEEAISDLRVDSSLASVTDAKGQLKRSISLLAPIPVWSPYYRQAQTILPTYEDQVRSLDYVTSAQEQAYSAAVASQDPPHPVSHWKQIAADWESASGLLEAVPTDSPVRELADRKLIEYRANRATILVRIESEATAEVGIRQAQQAAILGTQQIENAGSLADWEEALASWELAVDSLSQIPQGTNAHGEAQELLPEYLKTLEEVRVNTEQERNASRSLFQAKQFAAEAQRAETDEQWSTAVDNWQAASRQLQDTQQGTLAFSEAEALKGIYATSLGNAENNFQVTMRFQPVEPNFFAVCGMAGNQKCTYSVRSGSVRLDLFQGYDTVIDQSITPPDQRAIEASAPQLVGQSNQLLQEVAALSSQAQVPVELYDNKGEFMARYRPDLGGFTR